MGTITCMGWVVNETAKAVLFMHHTCQGRPVWLPKSQITIEEAEWYDLVVMPKWLASRNGMHGPTPVEREAV
jgi:hypothetical protein